jgi:three-Cys-motif partner protein
MKSMKQNNQHDNSNQETALIKPRKTQTKVKHTILERYLQAWGGIIINGLRQHASANIHLVYIDCHASYGRYRGELEDVAARRDPQPIFGTPIIGVKALDELAAWAKKSVQRQVRTSTILIEKERKVYDELKTSLRLAELMPRVHETTNFSYLQDGEIALVWADSTLLADQLVRYTQSGYKYSLFLLDPYGPTGIPFSFVSKIIQQPRHDTIIYVPYLDLEKKSGIAAKSTITPTENELIKNYDAMFGHAKWRTIVKQCYEADSQNENEVWKLEAMLMRCYRETLLSIDPGLTVKSIGLHFPDRDRIMYYLYLTTHDSNGALKMNELLWEAGYQEYELRQRLKQSKEHPGQLTLFDMPLQPKKSARPTKEEIGRHIMRLFKGQTRTKREIYAALADEIYFAKEVNNALKYLQAQGQISFVGPLENSTCIKIG